LLHADDFRLLDGTGRNLQNQAGETEDKPHQSIATYAQITENYLRNVKEKTKSNESWNWWRYGSEREKSNNTTDRQMFSSSNKRCVLFEDCSAAETIN
jgi:hypothetical protein